MDEFYQYLLGKSPVWANIIFFGTVIGLAVFIIANRTYIRQLRASYEERLKSLSHARSEQIDLKNETINMLERAKHESQLLLQEAAKDAVKERDVYRDRLHEEKANHQATILRLHEAESRPDLGRIITATAEFNKQMLQSMQSLELEMKKHSSVCSKSIRLMDVIIKTLIAKKILTAEQLDIDT